MSERDSYHNVARALGMCPDFPDKGKLIDRFVAMELRAATEEYRAANKARAKAYKKVQNDERDRRVRLGLVEGGA